MTVTYFCEVDLSEYDDLTAEDIVKVKAALDEYRYDWYNDGDILRIDGECEVDSYGTTAEDIAKEIHWILRDAADLDEDVKADGEPEDCESEFDEQIGYYYDGIREGIRL